MGRLCFLVAALLMASSISLVTARYQARQLYVELDRARESSRQLEITWRQLQLDRAEQALEQNDEAWLMDMLETAAQARSNWTGNQS